MAESSKITAVSEAVTQFRAALGMRLITLSAIGLFIIAILTLAGAAYTEATASKSGLFKDTAQLLFSSLLPLFGTWVGTVLAFYFSKENFEAASSQTIDLLRATGVEKLRSIPITKGMIPFAQMVILHIPAGAALKDIKLKDIQDKFDLQGNTGQRVSRLVIADSNNKAAAILHRSIWVEMISLGLQKTPPIVITTDKIDPLLAMPVTGIRGFATYGDLIIGSIAYVKSSASLADAKEAMESTPYCQDVIITQSGDRAMPILGWVTNADLGRLSEA